ncbi:MAG: SxtJ family membrane protein [Candidatus Hinthialibacter antarcticus]|nr:SxtJ family membrane protein [Candidatus Hinthialibacter antarcticus]
MHIWIRYSDLSLGQCKDAGMALCLICLLIGWFGQINGLYAASIIVLLINMTWAGAFKPFAWFWFSLSFVLGTVVSKIILSVLFFVLVVPIAFIRARLGEDPLHLKLWKQGKESAFKERNITFSKRDVERPF